MTSNYQSGVIPELDQHPLAKMMDKGLNVTINTDDPSISRITLSNEYHVVCDDLVVSMEKLKQRIVAAGQAAFLPEADRDALVETLKKELKL